MYGSEEVHLAQKIEYEYSTDDLNFLPPGQNSYFKLPSVRTRKTILKIAIAAAFVLLCIVLAYLLLHRKHLDTTFTVINSNDTFSGLALHTPSNSNHLIKFNTFIKASYQPYSENIETILQEYWHEYVNNSHLEDCSVSGLHSKKENCIYWQQDLGSCIHLQNYGYAEGRPCILLSLELPENTLPFPYKKSNPVVKKYLTGIWSKDHVPVTCTGETEADTRYLITQDPIFNNSITYSPLKGYSLDFFPQLRSPHYRAPLLMVQFNTLQPGLTVHVRCRVWAIYKNATKAIKSVVKFRLHMN
ncbi:sodium/potassium-transporting ATPase subunit beta [Octopus sinensis]|uniref:Sodium/potassium-transporting ATPase subunit beta n=1 Tax=Octopus sinensis TaxID=2607531 RepID=A0A6P7TD86_9MOLL|nr:sodium/potassium-transporting ATPase subunit beta [Octopus sinensis]